MNKKLSGFACLGIAAGIALGAFGAHGLRRLTTDSAILQAYQTGVDYHLFHALAFLVIGIMGKAVFNQSAPRTALLLMTLGVFLFSGSLYLMTLLRLNHWESRWVGPITPIGGTILILGWTWLALALLRKERSN